MSHAPQEIVELVEEPGDGGALGGERSSRDDVTRLSTQMQHGLDDEKSARMKLEQRVMGRNCSVPLWQECVRLRTSHAIVLTAVPPSIAGECCRGRRE